MVLADLVDSEAMAAPMEPLALTPWEAMEGWEASAAPVEMALMEQQALTEPIR